LVIKPYDSVGVKTHLSALQRSDFMGRIFFSVFLMFVNFGVLSENTSGSHKDACGLNEKSRILANLIINDPKQNRKKLVCNHFLSTIAAIKVAEMAKNKRVRHKMSNRRLIDAGYPLAKIYPRALENNVEALAGGISSPEVVWVGFKESDGHRVHLLAEHEFYMLQDEIGVGFINDPKTPHVEYWAVYVAHKDNNEAYKGDVAKSKN